MDPVSARERLIEALVRQHSEQQLRRLVARELPDLAPDLPGAGTSPRQLATALVLLAERRGYVLDIVTALLVRPERRPAHLRTAWTASAAVATLLGGATNEPVPSGMCIETTHTPAERGSIAGPLDMTPIARDLPDPPPRPRATKRRPLTSVDTFAEMLAPAPSGGPARCDADVCTWAAEMLAPAPNGGPARCDAGVCTVHAEPGHTLRGAEFCILPADGAEARRCLVRGDALQAATTATCDLSETRSGRLTGTLRWRDCDAP